MFYFWFNTGYIKKNYFCLRKRDLELACKDVACKHFSQGFKVELFFKPKGENQPGAAKQDSGKEIVGNCGKCSKGITAEENSVMLNDVFYHWSCLQCDKCGKNLNGAKNCVIKDDKPICQNCEGENFFSSCAGCFRPLTSQKTINIGEEAWHYDCFRCSYCSKLLNHKNSSNFTYENGLFCPEHVGMIIGNDNKRISVKPEPKQILNCKSPKCANPNRNNNEENMLHALGSHFHKNCFKCIECGKSFQVKDEYIEKDGLPCCENHDEPEEICYGCLQSVPSKNAISTFGESWHANCVRCYESNCSVRWNVGNIDEYAEMKQGKLICKDHGLLCCYNCKDRIRPNELITWEDKDLHSYCFVCGTCNNVIPTPNNPKTYFVDKGIPHCIKHQKVCTRCSSVIAPHSLLIAKGAPWHKQCFTCQMQTCKRPLDIDQFIVVRGKNYCTSHPQCTRCCTPIADNDIYEDHNGIFHKGCYVCGKCNTPINPEESEFLGNRLLCSTCHPAPKCARCYHILAQSHLVVGKQHYHEECFCCSDCGTLFASTKDPITLNDDGLPICKDCIKPKYVCYTCGDGIFDQVLETLGFTYHTSCFICECCKAPLSGSFSFLDDHVLCSNCSTTVQKSKCETCNKVCRTVFLFIIFLTFFCYFLF